MQVLQEVYGLEGDRVWTVAAGFGGGIARYQEMCGALTAGVMAMGLAEGQAPTEPDKKPADVVRPKVRKLVEDFRERFGAIDCRGLVPFDFSVPGGYEAHRASNDKEEKCHHYVRFVVETLAREVEAQRGKA